MIKAITVHKYYFWNHKLWAKIWRQRWSCDENE